MIIKEVTTCGTGEYGLPGHVMLYIWALVMPEPACGIFDFGEMEWHHSLLAFFVPGSKWWTQLPSPVTICYR
jgi:hypothetical protein